MSFRVGGEKSQKATGFYQKKPAFVKTLTTHPYLQDEPISTGQVGFYPHHRPPLRHRRAAGIWKPIFLVKFENAR